MNYSPKAWDDSKQNLSHHSTLGCNSTNLNELMCYNHAKYFYSIYSFLYFSFIGEIKFLLNNNLLLNKDDNLEVS